MDSYFNPIFIIDPIQANPDIILTLSSFIHRFPPQPQLKTPDLHTNHRQNGHHSRHHPQRIRVTTTATSPPPNIDTDQPTSYVLLAATSTFFVNTYHGLLTSRYRKASGIKYPTAYASAEQADKDPKAYTFNCGACSPPKRNVPRQARQTDPCAHAHAHAYRSLHACILNPLTAQRAHNNFTENLTPFLGALLIAGTKYPVYAAAIGGAWSLGRVLFARGYTSDGPQGRMVYVFYLLSFRSFPPLSFLLLRSPFPKRVSHRHLAFVFSALHGLCAD